MDFVVFIILFLFIMIIVVIVKKSSDNMKSDNNKEQMTSEVSLVGSFYRDNDEVEDYLDKLRYAESLRRYKVYIVPELNNQYDCNAMMVLSKSSLHLGYVPKEAAPQLRALYSKPIIVNGYFSRMEETGTERFYIHLQMLEFDSIDERNIELNNIMTKLH